MTANAVTCNFDGVQAPVCEIGATFQFPFQWLDANQVPKNLAIYTTAKMQVKDKKGKVIIELSLLNTRIDLDTNGTVMTLYIADTDTAILPAGKYVYDLFLNDGTTSIKLLKGTFYVDDRITVV